MDRPTERLSLVESLKRRKLVQWALAYLGGAWLLLQVMTLVGNLFAWPVSILRAATVLLAVGFVAALVIAWYHGEKGAQRAPGLELLMLAGILVIAGSAVAVVRQDEETPMAGAEGAAAALVAAGAEGHVEESSVAVLAFTDLSPEGDQEYFSDGIAEEILDALAQVPGLKVPARTSSFSFKGEDLEVGEIGRRLGVSHVLEGSVRKDGERIRITVRLVDASNGFQLWSERYDTRLESTFAVQDEIARSVTRALRLRFASEQGAQFVGTATSDPRAHDLYLQGVAFLHERELNKAIGRLEEAIERDPDFARAYAALALAYRLRPVHDSSVRPLESAMRGRAAADRALELDPSLAEAYAASGSLRIAYDWNFEQGERELRQAVERNPNDAETHRLLAFYLAQVRRDDDAVEFVQRTGKIDPLASRTGCDVVRVLAQVRRFEEAIAEGERRGCDFSLKTPYLALGRYEDAARVMLAYTGEDSTSRWRWLQEDILAKLARGEPPRTERLRQLELTSNNPDLAAWYALAGETDHALEILEQAVREHHPEVLWLTSPDYDLLRSHPRFQALLAEVGLPRFP